MGYTQRTALSYSTHSRSSKAAMPLNGRHRFTWKYLVVDEADRLKNMDGRVMRGLQALKTEYRLFVAGTPLNNLTESVTVWALLHVLEPRVFQDVETFTRYTNLDEATDADGKRFHRLLVKMCAILDVFVIRSSNTKSVRVWLGLSCCSVLVLAGDLNLMLGEGRTWIRMTRS